MTPAGSTAAARWGSEVGTSQRLELASDLIANVDGPADADWDSGGWRSWNDETGTWDKMTAVRSGPTFAIDCSLGWHQGEAADLHSQAISIRHFLYGRRILDPDHRIRAYEKATGLLGLSFEALIEQVPQSDL